MRILMSEGKHILKCPICSQDLELWFIQLHCTKAMFTKYCDLALQHYSRSQADFNWCLASKCGSGQIHQGGNARMVCVSCKASTCVHHQLPWRDGLTCAEFDDSGREQWAEEKKSLEKVQKTTVACPRCRAPIEKNGGCSHMKCLSRNALGKGKCGYEFCYYCLVPWQHDEPKHKSGCRVYQ
ncbi:hypothetical protein OCU04_004647 [Sclerotinia nivalis]|uniref:RBR-type E3 ubiquitin transferase n=1 Tax=Sclerotinia nivalis TaxID=352851 RepID=A0A9X0AQZ1_9HELO|nr:hypothetical protein OCU04_004647 [Sclerotinia nivalis]